MDKYAPSIYGLCREAQVAGMRLMNARADAADDNAGAAERAELAEAERICRMVGLDPRAVGPEGELLEVRVGPPSPSEAAARIAALKRGASPMLTVDEPSSEDYMLTDDDIAAAEQAALHGFHHGSSDERAFDAQAFMQTQGLVKFAAKKGNRAVPVEVAIANAYAQGKRDGEAARAKKVSMHRAIGGRQFNGGVQRR